MKRSIQDTISDLLEDDPIAALEYVREQLGSGEPDPDLLAFEAECLGELRHFDDAVDAWARYLEKDPEYLTAYVERARIFIELGRLDAADSELRTADDLFGEQAGCSFQRGFWLDARGSYDHADQAYTVAAEMDELLDPPPRFETKRIAKLVKAATGREVEVAPMPADAGVAGLGRLLERASGRLVVYQRNVEREMSGFSDIDMFVEIVVDVLAEMDAVN
jgi:tetratricopeptide (TPR) repeat protein